MTTKTPKPAKIAKTYTIDASGMSLGRVAAEAAKALMGKTSPDYTPNVFSDVKVSVINMNKLTVIRESKLIRSRYTHYTGYPGGLKRDSIASLRARGGVGAPLRKAVERMLPRNTFRTARLKNLTITA